MLSRALPLLSIVAVLFPMAFFMLASAPLLILKHDTPLDGRFIRGLFNVYYVAVVTLAGAGAVGCALAGEKSIALALGALSVAVYGIRRRMLATMDHLRDAIARGDTTAVPRFRRLHIAGMVVNGVQLGVVAWGMTRLAA